MPDIMDVLDVEEGAAIPEDGGTHAWVDLKLWRKKTLKLTLSDKPQSFVMKLSTRFPKDSAMRIQEIGELLCEACYYAHLDLTTFQSLVVQHEGEGFDADFARVSRLHEGFIKVFDQVRMMVRDTELQRAIYAHMARTGFNPASLRARFRD